MILRRGPFGQVGSSPAQPGPVNISKGRGLYFDESYRRRAYPPKLIGAPAHRRTGASAGGLEAFQAFFAHMPPDSGMAFVLVQHLSPHHESVLAEILNRAARIPVVEARQGMSLEPNRCM